MLKFLKRKDGKEKSSDDVRKQADARPAEGPDAHPSGDDKADAPIVPAVAGAQTPATQSGEVHVDAPLAQLTESLPASLIEPAPLSSVEPPPPARRNWRQRLGGSAFSRGVGGLFARNPKLDDALLDELETSLISADVGVNLATKLAQDLRRRMHKREFADAGALLAALKRDLLAILEPVAQPLQVSGAKPFVLLMVGVNGVGKTTTVGKLARHFLNDGLRVLLAAGDTFRAAAVEQLQAWGERNDVAVIAQGQGADSASVVFDALQSARARGSDVLIADTAGRLHTQGGLMDELAKVRRVLARLDASAPHEVLLVLDGGTGQNAISQVRQFRDAAGVTGLAVTKLDGTAKGGVVFALAAEFGLPLRYVGLGEGIDDLAPFDPAAFVDALLPPALCSAA